jgi:methylated-DNA-[protein]-cysteine S-methyltransferase
MQTQPLALAFALFDTALGFCGIAWGLSALTGVQLPECDVHATRARMRRRFPQVHELDSDSPPPEFVARAVEDIAALLRGEPHEPRDLSNIPVDWTAVPPFNRRVLELARTIAPGQTMTYGEIATRLGEPGAARAVGQALGHNPFAPVVPCHRVLAAGSASGGFSANGGVSTKLSMLLAERAVFGAPGLFD